MKNKKKNTSPKAINPRLKKNLQRFQKPDLQLADYVAGIQAGDRRILAQAITLIESKLPEQRHLAQEILQAVHVDHPEHFRMGITGSPGVGKSTFIEALGLHFIEQRHKVAVLSIDPSSSISKGSILGDKTRMAQLSAHPEAFVRPSPSGGTLGGVARSTRETIALCEAAGYDRILIETVGVGQSETNVYYMTDFFLLLLLPGAGDDLQGIKRGIVEMADMLLINKADGDRIPLAEQSKKDYQRALHLFPPKADGWQPPVMTCSALEAKGIKQIYDKLNEYRQDRQRLQTKRQAQNIFWLHETIKQTLLNDFFQNPNIRQLLTQKEQAVSKGQISPFVAAQELLVNFYAKKDERHK